MYNSVPKQRGIMMKLQLMYCENVLWCMMRCGVSELAMKL